VSYGKEELEKQFLPEARKHTGTIVYAPKHAQGPTPYGCASCVYIEYRSRRFAITCQHVTRDASSVYVLAIAPSNEPTPLGPVTQLIPATVLKEDAEHDLAVLDAQTVDFSVTQKQPFASGTSDFITQSCLEDQPGLLSFIYGTLGSKTELVPTGKNRYVEVPIYSAGGQIKTVTPTAITAEFKEQELLFHNVDVFPQLQDMKVSGGSRDLRGMSGSGLWIRDNHGVILAGILKGPASGEIADPEIRFTPIWVLRAILGKMDK
jgi:hypothetical protein